MNSNDIWRIVKKFPHNWKVVKIENTDRGLVVIHDRGWKTAGRYAVGCWYITNNSNVKVELTTYNETIRQAEHKVQNLLNFCR